MPHKHKRRGANDDSLYDLPPSVVAKSLPTLDAQKSSRKKSTGRNSDNNSTKTKKKPSSSTSASNFSRKYKLQDDTPRAFKQLLQYQQQKMGAKTSPTSETHNQEHRQKKNSDNSKKRKRNDTQSNGDNDNGDRVTRLDKKAASTSATSQEAIPKILPGEKFTDFVARVDRELPLSGMKKSGKPPSASEFAKAREGPRTKHEKHLLRLQRHWREEEEKIREREAAERDEKQTEVEDQLELWKKWEAEAGTRKAKKATTSQKKKSKNNRKNGNVDSDDGDAGDDPDPWAKLKDRDPVRQANPFDVVQAPPQLKKPKEVFKMRGGATVDIANVPAAAGSLRRREELAEERRSIVEEYRRLMSGKRQ